MHKWCVPGKFLIAVSAHDKFQQNMFDHKQLLYLQQILQQWKNSPLLVLEPNKEYCTSNFWRQKQFILVSVFSLHIKSESLLEQHYSGNRAVACDGSTGIPGIKEEKTPAKAAFNN